jgi:hypothetical protein
MGPDTIPLLRYCPFSCFARIFATMKRSTVLLAICGFGCAASAQSKKEMDAQAIKSMCGCYEVQFNYTETFAADTAYEFHHDHNTMAPAEWAFIVEETPEKIVIQHLLVMNDSTIIKHWRQDWIYENTDFYFYDKDQTWNYVKKEKAEVEGQWTQKVYQVDDSPRYQGSATWVHYDGRHFWENTTDAPLPRREYTTRDDYNVLQRTNRHEITEYGWLHLQDNKKIVRGEQGDEVLVEERGYNTYRAIDKSKCQAGIDWWAKQQAYWAVVRSQWDLVFNLNKTLTVETKIGKDMLFMELFDLGDNSAGKDPKMMKAEVYAIIEKYALAKKEN